MTQLTEEDLNKNLKIVAKEKAVTPAELWQTLILERFLARLAESPYKIHFILKGGTLLAKQLPLGRETKDIDFSVLNLSNDPEHLQKVFDEIAAIDLKDGFEFISPKVIEVDRPDLVYAGATIRVEVRFGKNRSSFFVDLSFGDAVEVKSLEIALLSHSKGPLFEQFAALPCYPISFIFAEKLETIVSRGEDNTRMKDFHDLLTLLKTEGLYTNEELQKAIQLVFDHRKTPKSLPLHFSDSALEQLQLAWTRYRKSSGKPKDLPANINEIISQINVTVALKREG